MYKPEHVEAWRRIVDFVHRHRARIALQLAHAGRKGSTRRLWEGIDEPLPEGNWPLLSASPLPYFPHSQVPREMTRADMDLVRDQFVRAAEMAETAGFDMLELHMAHGYLLASFISPLTNVRSDAYGGPLERRLRYPLEVLDAVRAVWPAGKPISVKISATDWAPEGRPPTTPSGSRRCSGRTAATPSPSRRARRCRTSSPSTGGSTRRRSATGSGTRRGSQR